MSRELMKALSAFFEELDSDDCPPEIRARIVDVLEILKNELQRD